MGCEKLSGRNRFDDLTLIHKIYFAGNLLRKTHLVSDHNHGHPVLSKFSNVDPGFAVIILLSSFNAVDHSRISRATDTTLNVQRSEAAKVFRRIL